MEKHPALGFALALLLVCSGCTTTAPLACPDPGARPRAAKVYFATDRTPSPGPGPSFGSAPADPPQLYLGWERVVIGPQHRLGRVDDAVVRTGLHSVQSPGGFSAPETLAEADAAIEAFVGTKVRSTIRSSPVPRPGAKRQVLMFIHGFNNSFDEAIRKTAQLAADLELVDCEGQERGVPIAYTWPSASSVFGYLADEESAEWTQQRLAPFLGALARVCREEGAELQVIAHSMGARLLVRSLADLASSSSGRQTAGLMFDQIILLAPDIGKGIFEQYLERIVPLVDHLTIYVSSKDGALNLSRILHGGHRRVGLLESSFLAALELTGIPTLSRRVGDRPARGGVADDFAGTKIDMIDVSGGIAARLGHSYEDPEFIGDLKELIYKGTPAGTGARSNLIPGRASAELFRNVGAGASRYFRLKTD
ncbi:MAG: alpha/beta hydrolase [Chthoniobacteraceae bacterium]